MIESPLILYLLKRHAMEANWIFLGYWGLVLRNSFTIELQQTFHKVLKLVASAILLVKF